MRGPAANSFAARRNARPPDSSMTAFAADNACKARTLNCRKWIGQRCSNSSRKPCLHPEFANNVNKQRTLSSNIACLKENRTAEGNRQIGRRLDRRTRHSTDLGTETGPPQWQYSGVSCARPGSAQIGLRRIAAHHSLAVEVCPDLADALFHHPDPALAVLVVKGQDGLPQLAI
jgi:hypothetical protein